jgi:phage shock protein A
MLEKFHEPKPYDAVRGGQLPPPVGAAVLGGLAGVEHRLSSSVSEHRIAALKETLNYGDDGLKILIKVCQSQTGPMQQAACDLLFQRLRAIAQEKLQAFVPSGAENAAESTKNILGYSPAAIAAQDIVDCRFIGTINIPVGTRQCRVPTEARTCIPEKCCIAEQKSDRPLSAQQLIFEKTTQQIQPNLLLLEALVASIDREKFTGELMYLWELLILEIQEPLKELRQVVASAISTQLRIQWQYNQAASQANQWQQRTLLALEKNDESSVRQARIHQQVQVETAAILKIDLDDQTVRVETLNRNLLNLESKIVEANSQKEILKMELHFAKVQEQINFTFNQVNTIFFSL